MQKTQNRNSKFKFFHVSKPELGICAMRGCGAVVSSMRTSVVLRRAECGARKTRVGIRTQEYERQPAFGSRSGHMRVAKLLTKVGRWGYRGQTRWNGPSNFLAFALYTFLCIYTYIHMHMSLALVGSRAGSQQTPLNALQPWGLRLHELDFRFSRCTINYQSHHSCRLLW